MKLTAWASPLASRAFSARLAGPYSSAGKAEHIGIYYKIRVQRFGQKASATPVSAQFASPGPGIKPPWGRGRAQARPRNSAPRLRVVIWQNFTIHLAHRRVWGDCCVTMQNLPCRQQSSVYWRMALMLRIRSSYENHGSQNACEKNIAVNQYALRQSPDLQDANVKIDPSNGFAAARKAQQPDYRQHMTTSLLPNCRRGGNNFQQFHFGMQ